MIKIYRGAVSDADILSREINDYPIEYENTVREILGEVREKGDAAVLAYTERFDRCRLASLEVTGEEIEGALSRVSPEFTKTLRIAKDNIAYFHRAQKRNGFERPSGVALALSVKF